MAKITGVGGVFFKAKNPKKLAAWYKKQLGLPFDAKRGCAVLRWAKDRAPREASTAWALADKKTAWFRPSAASFMINYRVDDMNGLLRKFKKARIKLQKGPETHSYGTFAWILDPEGNKIELWEPSGK